MALIFIPLLFSAGLKCHTLNTLCSLHCVGWLSPKPLLNTEQLFQTSCRIVHLCLSIWTFCCWSFLSRSFFALGFFGNTSIIAVCTIFLIISYCLVRFCSSQRFSNWLWFRAHCSSMLASNLSPFCPCSKHSIISFRSIPTALSEFCHSISICSFSPIGAWSSRLFVMPY